MNLKCDQINHVWLRPQGASETSFEDWPIDQQLCVCGGMAFPRDKALSHPYGWDKGVIGDGRITDNGSYFEVVRMNGDYSDLIRESLSEGAAMADAADKGSIMWSQGACEQFSRTLYRCAAAIEKLSGDKEPRVQVSLLLGAIEAHFSDPVCDSWTLSHLRDLLSARGIEL